MPKQPKKNRSDKNEADRWKRADRAAESKRVERAVEGGDTSGVERLDIVDPQGLWEILTKYGLTRQRPLAAHGIDPKQRERLIKGTVKTLSRDLFEDLLRATPDDQQGELTRALDGVLVSPPEKRLLQHAMQWKKARAGLPVAVRPRLPRFDEARPGRLTFCDPDLDAIRKQRFKEFVAARRRVCAVLPEHRVLLVGDRAALAWWRILEPLLDWQESGYTERHWSELTDDEFRHFVRAGLERESILSNRHDDLARVRQALVTQRPESSEPHARDGLPPLVSERECLDAFREFDEATGVRDLESHPRELDAVLESEDVRPATATAPAKQAKVGQQPRIKSFAELKAELKAGPSLADETAAFEKEMEHMSKMSEHTGARPPRTAKDG